MALTDTYLPDETHGSLVAALSALDRDPAHPTPLSDRIIEVLGEVANVWPASIDPYVLEVKAKTPAEKRVAKRFRNILEANAEGLAMLERIKPLA
ncbi:hypothetical protein [Sulfitobacter sp. PM12]|uniref:hypothetical protein n=1 Tax=Sulfitobacter sp. PM12 TaxID=3138497 RepID=UPI00388F9BEB